MLFGYRAISLLCSACATLVRYRGETCPRPDVLIEGNARLLKVKDSVKANSLKQLVQLQGQTLYNPLYLTDAERAGAGLEEVVLQDGVRQRCSNLTNN